MNQIKALLLEILESAFQGNGDITATQQMGVNMSNAVKRDGVVIIQNQNVEIYKHIVPPIVKAIKLCDAIEPIIEIRNERTVETDPIKSVCEYFFENNISWQNMQDTMKERYLEYVIEKHKTKTDAARFLGVGSTYLCKLSR